MFDAKMFLDALDEIESTKGISKESVLASLKEAMEKGYKKELGFDDADVRVTIDSEKGTIEMVQVKKVVDDVEDYFLEISVEDANKEDKSKKYKAGDEFFIPANIDELRKATALSVKSVLRQKLAEAEKEALSAAYQDKIGEMITGRVEKVEENGVSVNIGRTSIYVQRKDLIAGERFKVGDAIKLYVSDVASGPKGAHIVLTRSNEAFLKHVFEEEIREIYDGTIIIKNIARQAGERSKVSVYSNDPNVDPAGACIGPNGSRIQKVVAQLGNSQNKEKIDIIAYSHNVGLYIMESLKPAQVLGIVLDEEAKKSLVIVKDGTLSLAIGRKGVNVHLASKLTGFGIDIKEESDATKENISYVSFAELKEKDNEEKARVIYEAPKSSVKETLGELPAGYVAPSERVYADEVISKEEREALESVIEIEENRPSFFKEEKKVEEEVTSSQEVKEESKDVKPISVKTTTTLESLEKELSKEEEKKPAFKKPSKKKVEEVKEEEKLPETKKDPSSYMSIYTDEELKELEKEENLDEDNIDEEEDYDEYDKYYDDEEK